MTDDHSRDFWSFLECRACEIPRHHTESCRVDIGHHTRVSLDVARHDFTSTLSRMRVDEMVMSAPLSLRTSTTGEKVIFEQDGADHFIRSKGTLEPHFPSSLTIEISPEVDKVSRIFLEVSFYDIDQVPLPHSPELEHDIRVKDYRISYDFYIPIISFFRNLDSCLRRNEGIYGFILHSSLFTLHELAVSELRKPLADGRIEVSIGLSREIEHKYEHSHTITIECCSTISIQVMKPIPFEKSGIFCLELAKSRLYLTENLTTILGCIE